MGGPWTLAMLHKGMYVESYTAVKAGFCMGVLTGIMVAALIYLLFEL